MRKTMFKTICVITLVFFVMSMTGAAACSSCYKCKVKTDAVNDKFTLNCKSKSYCNNVLKNDKGCNLKVAKPGCFNTKLGGKICIQSNGKFCYTKPAKCTKASTDSFVYFFYVFNFLHNPFLLYKRSNADKSLKIKVSR